MTQSDQNYVSFLKGELDKAKSEIAECNRKESALIDQISMINESKNFATSDRIRLEKELETMAESA